ncbi:hypothetical protein D7X30_11335 [Corallococcus sp. AB011P]|nr:hypothetical protein D7X30_11335 [Corallococcus sp. AB011P]
MIRRVPFSSSFFTGMSSTGGFPFACGIDTILSDAAVEMALEGFQIRPAVSKVMSPLVLISPMFAPAMVFGSKL